MKRNFYYAGREWAYKHVTPKILAEVYLEEEEKGDLKDYKIFHFLHQKQRIPLIQPLHCLHIVLARPDAQKHQFLPG